MVRTGSTYSTGITRAGITVFLGLLLLLMTNLNYFQTNSSGICAQSSRDLHWSEDSGSGNPAGTDEKPAGNAFSFNEEYVHEGAAQEGPAWISLSCRYPDAVESWLPIHSGDILSPPPEIG